MVSHETVLQVLERMSTLPDEDAQLMVTEMSEEQPMLLAYLLATSENETFDRDEEEAIFYIGMVIYQIMKEGGMGPAIITEEQIEKAEKANEDLLEKVSTDSAGDFLSAADTLITDYPEPEVLRYMTEALMEDEDGNPDYPPVREESLGLAYLNLKIFLDAMAEA